MLTKSISRAQLQFYVKQKDWDSITKLCQSILSAETQSEVSEADCWALLGKACMEKGEEDAAIAAYTESLKRQPQQHQSNYALGLLYARQKRHSRAICHYQAALLQKPNWAEAAYKLGSLLKQLGQSEQAIKTYRQILQHTPTHIESYFALGELYSQSGQRELAMKQYRQALFARPDSLNAYRYVGTALARMGEYTAAAAVYQQALSQFPDNALMHGNLGQMKLIQGDTHSAMEAYHKSLSLDPDLAITNHNLGLLWRNHQNLDKAADYLRAALKLEPDSIPILANYTGVLLATGDWPNLLDCFRMAIAHQPDWVNAYCEKTLQRSEQDPLFQLQQLCGRFLIGLQQAETASTATVLKECLGQLYRQMGLFSALCDAPDRAEQCYRVAIALDPDALDMYSELGKTLMEQGRKAAAIAIYQAGILQAQNREVSNPLAQPSDQPSDSGNLTVVTVKTLRSQLEKALLSNGTSHQDDIAGVYTYAQDWLAEQVESAAQGVTTAIPAPTGAQPESNCGGVTCQLCMGNLMRKFSPVQVGKQAYQCKPEAGASDLSFPTFTTTIPQGSAWIAPQNNTWDVCNEIAIFTPDRFLLGDLSRAFPWYLPGCNRHDILSYPVLHRSTPLPPVQHIPGKVAVLSALSGHIYYHWMFDLLPRVNILQQSLQQQGLTLGDIDYFVVNSLEKKFQTETLEAVGIPLEKVIVSDRTPHIQAEQLISPSFPGYLDWVPPSSMDFLRAVFLPGDLSADSGTPNMPSTPAKRRLYINRSKAKYRQVFNEAAVVELLSRFGFESVALETLSVAQQARLFSEAEAVVAPHGSGLTNLVFCSPNTAVIEFFSSHYMRTDYWMISEYLQLNHYYLVSEGPKCYPLRQLMYPSGLTEDISVDIMALRSLLKTAGLNPA